MDEEEKNLNINEVLINPKDINELRKKYVNEKILDNGNRQAIFYFDKDYNLTDKDNAYYVRIEEYNSKNYLIKCDVEELFDNE
ncbi:MAG: hypothetical protein MSH29_02350 [Tenericutes bacterium]|nr:hypothetical protein [Mycoplasmatota bacterium]MDD7629545.1 hypothetical protein [bacterium]MDY4109158.1 hypothetical protein [Bacilli bacterium]